MTTKHTKQEDQTTATDRREHPRHSRDLQVQYLEIAGSGTSCNAQLRDISQGGLCMLSERPIPLGRLLVLGLELNGAEQPFVARGVVRHCTPRGRDPVHLDRLRAAARLGHPAPIPRRVGLSTAFRGRSVGA